MYRNSSGARSWSNFFGHGTNAVHANKENKSEVDLSSIKFKDEGAIESKHKAEKQVDGSMAFKVDSSLGNNGSFYAAKHLDAKAEVNKEYIHDILTNFGGNYQDNQEKLKALHGSPSSQYYYQNAIDSPFSSSEDEEDESASRSASGKLDFEKIPDLSQNPTRSSSPLRVRERLSQVFGKSKKHVDKSNEESQSVAIIEDGLANLDIASEKSETPIPKVVKKKSSIKFSSIVGSYESFENDILEANPCMRNFQLYPSAQIRQPGGRHEESRTPFSWSVWENDEFCFDQLNEKGAIRTIGQANKFVESESKLLYKECSEVHVMRLGMVPDRKSKELLKAGTLEIRIIYNDERRFVIWNFLVHLILSNHLYEPHNIHEPVVGLGWHSTERYPVVSILFARCHRDNSEQEKFELSRICHYIRGYFPTEVAGIMDAENLIYSVSTS